MLGKFTLTALPRPGDGSYIGIKDAPRVPTGRSEQAEGVTHECREVDGPRPWLCPVGAITGPARGPPAICPRSSVEGPARRPRGARGGTDRPFRRPLARG